MALNLSRNTKVWFTTNVDVNTGVISDSTSGFTTSNTYEIQVLDGYSFSQLTDNQVVTVTEAGARPVRGQRSFNTRENAGEFTFSVYLRPEKTGGGGIINYQDRMLWNALLVDADPPAGSLLISGSTFTRASSTSPSFTGLQVNGGNPWVVGNLASVAIADNSPFNLPFKITDVQGTDSPYTLSGDFVYAPRTTQTVVVLQDAPRIYKGIHVRGAGAGISNVNYLATNLSNKHQLQKFGLIFQIDNVFYALDDCSLNEATIDFGIDQIATTQWSGNSTNIKQLNNITASSQITATGIVPTAGFLANKLSTVKLATGIASQTTPYNLPITGGSITFSNNNTYLIPEILGVVNYPIGYYTGTRSITGSITAYLRTGSVNESGQLLATLLTAPVENKYSLDVFVGGETNLRKLVIEMPGVTLQIPSVEIADVVSTTINFTAQPFDSGGTNSYNVENTNEAIIRFMSDRTS